MSTSMLVVLAVTAGAVILFLTERVRADLVAILVLLALAVTGVIDDGDALAGFASPAVVTVAAMLVLGAGLRRTGVAHIAERHLARLAGAGERRPLAALMSTAGLLSAFVYNIGATALLLPAVLALARRLGRPPSKLLMPLAFAVLLGGLTTLMGAAPNIIVSTALGEAGFAPFGLFEFAPIGLAALAAGTAYMVLGGRRLLPERDLSRDGDRPMRKLEVAYGLGQRLGSMTVPHGSALDGRSLAQSRLGSALGLNVIAITRAGQTRLAPGAEDVLRAGDKLLVEGRFQRLSQMRNWRHLVLEGDAWNARRLAAIHVDLAAVTVADEGGPAGQCLAEYGFRRRHALNVLAIRRDGVVQLERLATEPLRPGDELLVQGAPGPLERLAAGGGLRLFRRVDVAEANERFHLHERMIAVRVPAGSLLAGKMLAESRLGNAFDLSVLGVLREGGTRLMPDPGEELRAGDTLLVQGRPEDLLTLQGLQELDVQEPPDGAARAIVSDGVGLAELMLAPGSALSGRTLRLMRFRERYGLTVVAIWSQGHAYRSDLGDRPVGLGDALLVHGPQEKLDLMQHERNFLVLSGAAREPVEESKAPVGAAIMAGVVASVLLGWLPVATAATAGAALMLLTGCLPMDDVYRHVDWKAIVLIAGMLSLGAAMQQTGTAEVLARSVLASAGQLGPLAVIAALYWLTALAAQVMPTAVVATLASPIAIEAASALAVNHRALMMVVAIGASSAFMSPLGHPVNMMVMGLGGYRFADYARVGLPLVLLNFLIALILVPVLFPLSP